MSGIVIVALVAIGLLAWLVIGFNALIRARNLVRAAFADIDVQLTRRHELVPNLVSAVKGYAVHEKATLEAATALRAAAVRLEGAQLSAQRPPIENALGDAVGRLLVIAEAYPDLKASENFAQLQRDLVEVEDHLQYARRFYNGAVRQYNDRLQQFPDLLIARPFGFVAAAFYSDDRLEVERAPEVRL